MQFNRRGFIAGGAFALSACGSTSLKPDSQAQAAADRLYIDGLSFLRGEVSDFERSGLHAAIVDISDYEEITRPDGSLGWVRTFAACDKSIDAVGDVTSNTFKTAYVAKKGSDIDREKGVAIFLQFQSCEPIEDDLGRIEYFHNKGLRLLQLTHHHDNLFAGGAIEPKQSGLTPLGRDGVAEMNRLKIIPDVSHASELTALEVAEISNTPIILSHGACRAIVEHPRCASDNMIRAVAGSGGVMGVFMMSFWLTTDPEPTVDHYIAHLRHLANIGGMEAVAISNDFPPAGQLALRELNNDNAEGVKQYHDWWRSMHERGVPGYATLPKHVVIPELNNPDRMQLIERALEAEPFFSAADIDKIMGENWRRVLNDVLV